MGPTTSSAKSRPAASSAFGTAAYASRRRAADIPSPCGQHPMTASSPCILAATPLRRSICAMAKPTNQAPRRTANRHSKSTIQCVNHVSEHLSTMSPVHTPARGEGKQPSRKPLSPCGRGRGPPRSGGRVRGLTASVREHRPHRGDDLARRHAVALHLVEDTLALRRRGRQFHRKWTHVPALLDFDRTIVRCIIGRPGHARVSMCGPVTSVIRQAPLAERPTSCTCCGLPSGDPG